MRFFVAKNKNGKYFSGFDKKGNMCFSKKVFDAVWYNKEKYKYNELKHYDKLKDCEILELELSFYDGEEKLNLDEYIILGD